SVMQKVANVNAHKAHITNIIAFLASIYSLYALYTAGFEAMMYGSIVTFAGWTLYGLISPKYDVGTNTAILKK
ncbi:MAG: hypothetical protein RR795_09745, partial [Cetobacterium sp.]